MTELLDASPLQEVSVTSARDFAALRAGGKPAVIRSVASEWPAVVAAGQGDAAFCSYLLRETTGQPISAIVARPEEGGRFFYKPDMTGLNFMGGKGDFAAFLSDLQKLEGDPNPPAMAVQSTVIAQLLPHFERENRLEWVPTTPPRLWIGNQVRVAPHYDVKENIAVCASGRRRFTLFPPDQISNLYPGPFELTPAGTPVSMVDQKAPDLDQYPRYAEAWKHAQHATLEPGDAIYIPYCWWHGVEALDPVSCLVNYWWNDVSPELAGPYDALLHALAAFRHLPDDQREVWRGMLDHYVFEKNGDPAAHLPTQAKGVLAPPSRELFGTIRQILRQALG